jgi:hypothetical protein
MVTRVKIRQGWISNSSTSSFIIVGYQLPDNDLTKFLGADGEEEREEAAYDKGLGIYDSFYPSVLGQQVFRAENGGRLNVERLTTTLTDLEEKFGEQLGKPSVFVGAYSDN